MNPGKWAVGLIVLAQWLGTSLWFSPNSAADDLMAAWQIGPAQFAWLIAATQAGFIAGTLCLAGSGWADRYSTSRIFALACIAGAVVNAGFSGGWTGFGSGLAFRFAVGVCLAGIYPLGMKMIVGWVGARSGAALGLLVGMLTLGTALPHGVRALGASLPWQSVVQVSSVLAVTGAALVYFLGDGPYLKKSTETRGGSFGRAFGVFRIPDFRAAAFGYFGHMWELYAFIVLVPLIVSTRLASASAISAGAFWAIGAGFAGCVGGGLMARRLGSARVAQVQLATSAACCVASPLMLSAPLPLFFAWLLLWGATVAGDSPQFSTLTAQNAPPAVVGSVLTFSNSIGFAISVLSIQLFVAAAQSWPLGAVLPWLAVGPAIGLWMMRPLLPVSRSRSCS
ncbi:MAG: major facilitator superfamily 1 [Polaromonas sp.]|nr:major facilitator superfamily 1 [Polaromonas sp.]